MSGMQKNQVDIKTGEYKGSYGYLYILLHSLRQVLHTDHGPCNLLVHVLSINNMANNKGKSLSELMGSDWTIRD